MNFIKLNYKKIVPMIGALQLLCSSSHAELARVMSYNVNTDRRVESPSGASYATHGNWRFGLRMDRLQGQIIINSPDLLFLQEMDIHSVEVMKALLSALNYEFVTQDYRYGDPMAFRFVFAVKKDKYQILASEPSYFSIHPDRPTERSWDPAYMLLTKEEKKTVALEENFGEEFEKSVQQVLVRDKSNGRTLFAFNNHFGLRERYRLESARLLPLAIESFIKKHEGNESSPVVISGDFNAFPDAKGAEQMATLLSGGFENLIQDAKAFDGVSEGPVPAGTFCKYPYDGGLSTIMGGWLDFVLGRNVKVARDVALKNSEAAGITDFEKVEWTERAKSFRKNVLFQPMLSGTTLSIEGVPADAFTSFISSYISESDGRAVPAFPSDHMALLLDILY